MSRTRSAICAHRLAIERARSVDAVCSGLPLKEVAAAEAMAERLKEEERAAWARVTTVLPDNASDLSGLAVHFGQVIDEFDHDIDKGRETYEAFMALRGACLALAGRTLVP